MPYLNEAGLSRYDPKLKEWISTQPVKTLPSSLYPWTLSGKAGAVGVWPVGGTELKPTVDFMFSETPPASGDKGPDNPSTITGVSSLQISRTNKNLLSLPYHTVPGVRNGITWTINSDGSITATGTAGTGGSSFYIAGATAKVHLAAGKTYFLSGTPTVNDWGTYIVAMGNSGSSHYYKADLGSGGTFVPDNEQLLCFASVRAGVTVDNYTFRPQIEEGTEATSFEPIQRSQITINLGSTYYGGTLDVASGVMTVTWVGGVPPIKYVDSVSDNLVKFAWNYNGEYRFYGGSFTQTKISSTHFINTVTTGDERIALAGNNDGTSWGGVLVISDARIGGAGLTNSQYLANAQQWLVENSVVFAAQIWTPFTVQLSPTSISALTQPDKYTPRLNTIYTDASAVQVGYVKSPIREEQELAQAIVAQGGNI